MAEIVSITYTPVEIENPRPDDHFARIPVEEAELIAGQGIDGDRKGGTVNRQLNVMLGETVLQLRDEGYHTEPGELGEQIVIADLDPAAAAVGTRLRLGDSAVIELVSLRVPCARFARIQGHAREKATGRIGFMARVVQGGMIRVGDPVRVEPAE